MMKKPTSKKRKLVKKQLQSKAKATMINTLKPIKTKKLLSHPLKILPRQKAKKIQIQKQRKIRKRENAQKQINKRQNRKVKIE